MLVVYSNKVKESNHHTICMWIDYAQKKKNKTYCHLPYSPSTRCLTVVVCWLLFHIDNDERRKKLIPNNKRRLEWNMLCCLLVYIHVVSFSFSLSFYFFSRLSFMLDFSRWRRRKGKKRIEKVRLLWFAYAHRHVMMVIAKRNLLQTHIHNTPSLREEMEKNREREKM